MSTPPPAPSKETQEPQAEAAAEEPEAKPAGKKRRASEPRQKRGPARPHRRLDTDVIEERIAKLKKRLNRAKSQIEDATRHVEGYLRERQFREQEAAK